MILAGDIGGTKTVLALFEPGGDAKPRMAGEPSAVRSAEHDSLRSVVQRFLRERGARPQAACFGVAGPVVDARVRATNLPWVVDAPQLAEACAIPRVLLLNDLEAAAYGMLVLGDDEFAELNPDAASGRGRCGPFAVIAAGTGLGEAVLSHDGARYRALASEGGHADFAPVSERQIELLRYLRAELGGHVSYERVLSGPGIHNVYRFLRDTGAAPERPELAARIARGDPAAEIAAAALSEGDPLARAALDEFGSVYGAEAGNLVLRHMAAGVYVGGGIAPKILPALRSGAFLSAFRAKGRFAELLRATPVRVALNPRAPLLGAAHRAQEL